MNEHNNTPKKEEYHYADLKGFHRAVPILLAALATFISICYITDIAGGSGETGVLGNGISLIFKGLFSYGAYAIPLMLIIHAVFYAEDLGRGRIVSRVIFSAVTVLIVSIVEYAICYWDVGAKGAVFSPVEAFTNHEAGGFIGNVFAFLLVKVFGPLGLIIVAVAVLAIYVAFFYAGTNSTLGRVLLLVLEYITVFLAKIEKLIVDLIGRGKDLIREKKQKQIEERQAELCDDDFFEVDNGMQRMEIKKLGIKQSKNENEIESNPHLHHKVHIKSAVPSFAEDEPEENEEPTPAPAPKATRTSKFSEFNFNYNLEEDKKPAAKEEPKSEEAVQEKTEIQPERVAYGLDAKAESVFTKDFDPFNFDEAEKIASRMSSKAPIREKIAPIYGEAVDLDNLTEEDVKRIREREALAKKMEEAKLANEKRRLEFEARKQAIVQQFKSGADQAAEKEPESAPRVSTTYSAPTFTEYSSHSAKEDIFAVKEAKARERRGEDADLPSTARETAYPSAAPSYAPPTQSENYRDTYSNNVNAQSYNAPAVENAHQTETKVYNEPAKTVAFNVSSEVAHHAPIEDKTLQFTHEKAQKPDNTEEVALAVAKAVAMKNPMYARSENVTNGSYSYTIKEDPVSEEPEFKSFEPIQNADFGQREASIIPTLDAERTMLSPEPVNYGEKNDDFASENATSADTDAASAYTSGGYQRCNAPASSEASSPLSYGAEKSGEYGSYIPANTPTANLNDKLEKATEDTDISATFTPVEDIQKIPSDYEEDELTWTDGLAASDDHDKDDIFEEDEISSFENVDDNVRTEQIPLEEQNPDVIRMREQFTFLAEEDKLASAVTSPEEDDDELEDDYSGENADFANDSYDDEDIDDEDEDDTPPFEPAKPSKPLPPAPVEKKEVKPKADFSNYKLPTVDMLISPPVDDEDYTEEIQNKANKLINALESFNVIASIKGVDRGPRITRYEVVPARGVKVSQIMSLQDDIALNLAAQAIRMEAPIPGKTAIGVEIPNDTSATVYLRDLIETVDFQNNPSKTTICIGKDVTGAPVFGDVVKMPHLLVAGATGMGKSVCINAFMISLLYKAKPDEVKFIMIDPKKVEFKRYNGIPHLLIPVVSEMKQAAGALMWAVDEMERRYALIESLYVRDIDGYNAKVKNDPSLGEVLPKIVIVIDEFADLMLQVKDPVEKLVSKIVAKARAAGIHMIVGTQRPSVQVITGTIKANIPSRIACKVASYVDSRTILEASGAERLLGKGDMLFSFAGAINPVRVQGAFVSDGELDDILGFIKSQSSGESYDTSVLDEINRAAQRCSKKSGDSDDEVSGRGDYEGEGWLNNKQFLDAVEIAVSQGKISTSLLQRKISIGFGKAAKFIDIMEEMGIVDEKNGAKPRDVLITADEWREKLSRTTYD